MNCRRVGGGSLCISSIKTMRALAEKIAQITNRETKIEFIDSPRANVGNSQQIKTMRNIIAGCVCVCVCEAMHVTLFAFTQPGILMKYAIKF